MCGIGGIYGKINQDKRRKALENISKALQHRGPDGTGFYESDQLAFVHKRLSIIDLSDNGAQPFYNEDGSVVLVCNGEIYNYKELRESLVKNGHNFKSNSDSEVVLHLYEEHRADPAKFINMLTGMFAFAIWDTEEQQLLIVRDRLGIKPLYYAYKDSQFLFASEVKAVVSSRLINSDIDPTSLFEYFMLGSIPAPNTFYAEIKVLEPGHYILLKNDKLINKQYWNIQPVIGKWRNEEEVIEATGALLSKVVKDHLVADVEVGTFLSAGVDSSLIASLAVEHHPGIHSFTMSFLGEPEDEGTIANETAIKLGTTHHSYELAGDFFDDFVDQFKHLDQPFAITSGLSLGRISKLAKRNVKVVLSGDGGDELFAGYDHRHKFPALPVFLKYIPCGLQPALLKYSAKLTGKNSLDELRKNLLRSNSSKYFDKVKVHDAPAVLALFSPDVQKQVDTERYLRHLQAQFDSFDNSDPLNQLLYVDCKTSLVDEMLTKCDRMTMINGIEGRVPFLDHRMVELAFSIPSRFKRRDGYGKIMLRELLSRRLGKQLAYREKTGFNSPLAKWLSKDEKTKQFAVQELSDIASIPFFNKDILRSYNSNGLNDMGPGVIFYLICLKYFIVQGENSYTYTKLPA